MFGICANSIAEPGHKRKPNRKFKNCRKRFLAARRFACILVLFERKRGFGHETVESGNSGAPRGRALGQHGTFCAQAQRRGALCDGRCAGAHALGALVHGNFHAAFLARELPYPPQRPLVLSGLGHREFASFFAVLFFRHAGYEPERHGGSALHLARNHHDSERCFVP